MDLREKVARLECPAFDDCSNEIKAVLLGRADRAIAAMFDHLENVTPEMKDAAGSRPSTQMAGEAMYLAMLAAARKEAEK